MQLVKVRLRKPSRVLSFLNPDIFLQRDEACVVRSDRGLEFGACVVPSEPCPPELAQRIKMSVIRKLSYHDESTLRHLLIEERKAQDLCAAKMRARNLPMRLADVEYSMDKRKVVFYFAAEDRVDFRELVRDLAHDLKTRIELRHIQVRDAAKMIGGLGTCGRELCCTTWLQEFMPISMKMAKRQNLSLNPTKISGQCGRLMCCISYENEMYIQGKTDKAAEPKALEAAPDADENLDDSLSPQDLFRLKLEADAATARAEAREKPLSSPDAGRTRQPVTQHSEAGLDAQDDDFYEDDASDLKERVDSEETASSIPGGTPAPAAPGQSKNRGRSRRHRRGRRPNR